MGTKSNDIALKDLLDQIDKGSAQLPEFQRNWVWSDQQICKLIHSLASGYPMGAVMFLEYNPEKIRFKYRPFTGVSTKDIKPTHLVLDGQQRLTSLYQVLKSQDRVVTCNERNRNIPIYRYYYLDIRKAVDPDGDISDAIISVPENKIIYEDIGRTVKLDLSTREKEFEALMFPLNILFTGNSEESRWMLELLNRPNSQDLATLLQFKSKILDKITSYNIPVICIDSDTEKEAVCQIFENVNTGGVPLTVFELVTAIFAADDFDLRKDWVDIKSNFLAKNEELLRVVDETNFITAVTLFNSYKKSLETNAVVSCKRRDVLKLSTDEYKAAKDSVYNGFIEAANFLVHRGIFAARDLPYSTQLIPLAAIFAFDAERTKKLAMNIASSLDKLSQWYWCGVLGELYGGANESRYALDIAEFFKWLEDDDAIPDTVIRANFQVIRLLSLRTRNSAAYKGIMALVMNKIPRDFMNGESMNIAAYLEEQTDIHHIFPQAYCTKIKLPEKKWNSVINKTPIYATTNRSIGGRAPSEYLNTMKNKGRSELDITEILSSHQIDVRLLKSDDFDAFIVDRAQKLIGLIEKATGKTVSGKDSEETIREFGCPLTSC